MTDFRKKLKHIAVSVFDNAFGIIYFVTALCLIGLGFSDETVRALFYNRLLVLLAGISMFVVPYRIWVRTKENKK